MGAGLQGKRVVIAASRKTEEMCTLVEKQGGVGLVRPLQGTVFLAEKEVEPDVRWLVDEGVDWLILTTGIGTEALLGISDKLGLKDEVVSVFQRAKVARRGYKLVPLLKKLEVEPVAVDDDGTTQGLIRSLASFDFKGQSVAVQLHGDPAPKLIEFLEERGATVRQILPYRHVAPDESVVEQFVQELLAGKIDAVCFTTAIQARFLFEHVKKTGMVEQVLEAFGGDVLAVAVGKITAEALRDEGIVRVLAPEHERMGAMIIELAEYMEKTLAR